MPCFITEILAVDPFTKELCTWCGPQIEAKSKEEAQNYCLTNGLGYCKVIGELVEEHNVEQIWQN